MCVFFGATSHHSGIPHLNLWDKECSLQDNVPDLNKNSIKEQHFDPLKRKVSAKNKSTRGNIRIKEVMPAFLLFYFKVKGKQLKVVGLESNNITEIHMDGFTCCPAAAHIPSWRH